MIKGINHIGIVVQDIEEALGIYHEALGLGVPDICERPDLAAKIAFVPIGESKIELVQPLTSESDAARFLEKRGEGIHHICLEVADVETALDELRGKGLQLIDEVPRVGPEGERFAFIHPKSLHSVLVELYEAPTPDPAQDG